DAAHEGEAVRQQTPLQVQARHRLGARDATLAEVGPGPVGRLVCHVPHYGTRGAEFDGAGRKPRQRWAADVLCEPRCGFRDAIRKETEPHRGNLKIRHLSSTRTRRFLSATPYSGALLEEVEAVHRPDAKEGLAK